MSQKKVRNMKPFVSVVLLMIFLFSIAFVKMENRRMGYSFVKLAQKEKLMRLQRREKLVELAKMTGPQRVQFIATQRLPMKKAANNQIIQMTQAGHAILQ